jgi:hypothetical protein
MLGPPRCILRASSIKNASHGGSMKRRLHATARIDLYSRWHEVRYRSGDVTALVEFAWKFPATANSARWFRTAVARLITIIILEEKKKRCSLRKIAATLNRMRIPAPRGGKWFASSVRAHRPSSDIRLAPRDAGRILCAIYGPKRQDLSWWELVARGGDSAAQAVHLLWDLHRLMKEHFRLLRQDILARFRRHERKTGVERGVRRGQRLASYVSRCWGTRELPNLTLRAALLSKGLRDRGILDALSSPEFRIFLDRPLSQKESVMLVTRRLDTAVTEILCGRFAISPRTAYRYKPVQKPTSIGSINVTPLD